VGPRNNVLDWGRDTAPEGVFLGVFRPIEKHWDLVLRRFTSKKINNGDSGTAASACSALGDGYRITLSRVKNSPPARMENSMNFVHMVFDIRE